MNWEIALLVGVIVMLWWIRAALEPLRAYFARKNYDQESRAQDLRDEMEAEASRHPRGSAPE